MTVPIGISFGDLVALIKVLKAVGSAFKSSGGAAEDFQQTVKQLEVRAAVLEIVANDKSTTGEAIYANAIRAQAQLLERNIKDVLATLQPYEAALGLPAVDAKKESMFKASLQKIKWATRASKHVEGLQREHDISLSTAQTFLSLNSSVALSSLESTTSKTLGLVDDQNQMLGDIQSIAKVLDKRTSTLEPELTSLHRLQAGQSDSISTVEANSLQTIQLLDNLLVGTRSSSRSLGSTMTSIHERMLLQDQIQNLKLDEIDSKLSGALNVQHVTPESLTMVLTGTYQVTLGMCKLLAAILTYAMEYLAQMLDVVPTLSTILSIVPAIPMAISWKLSNNILLIDVLGRKHDLPFQQFRSWSLFKGMLSTRFQDVPGSDRVASGSFKIMVAKAQHVLLDENNYAEIIEPHMRLVMSIEIVKLRRQVQRGSCLRHACLGTLRASGDSISSCSQCGLHCYEDTDRILKREKILRCGPRDFRNEVDETRRFLERLEKQKRSQRRDSGVPKADEKSLEQVRNSDEILRQELSEWVRASEGRATLRKEKGWSVDLHQKMVATRERRNQEALEKEKAELSLFLRVHITTTIYKPSSKKAQPSKVVKDIKVNVPAPMPNRSMQWAVGARPTLVDIVMECESGWAVASMANALDKGAEVDAVDPAYGTALQVSASIGCLIKTSFLLSHGANPFMSTGAFRSAIYAAAIHNHGEALGLLLESCHEAITRLDEDRCNVALEFYDTCGNTLQAATLRGCNSSVLALLNFTDRVHVGTAIFSGDRSTKQIVMGEAIRTGKLSLYRGAEILRSGSLIADEGYLEVDVCKEVYDIRI